MRTITKCSKPKFIFSKFGKRFMSSIYSCCYRCIGLMQSKIPIIHLINRVSFAFFTT